MQPNKTMDIKSKDHNPPKSILRHPSSSMDNQQEFNRPLSVYDNLSSTSLPPQTSNERSSTTDNPLNSDNAFPYDLSFKFDDLPNKQKRLDPMASMETTRQNNHYNDQVHQGYTNQQQFITKHKQNNNNINNNNNNTPVFDMANNNQINNTIHKNNNTNANANSSCSSSTSNSNDNNNINDKNIKILGTTTQYENVSETVRLRNSLLNNKPVISDAKSSFFGLVTSAQSSPSTSPVRTTMTPTKYNLTTSGPWNSDKAPLISVTHTNSNRSPPPVATSQQKSNGEYQNIPSNSASFIKHVTQSPTPTGRLDQSNDYPTANNSNNSSLSSDGSPATPHQYQDIYDASNTSKHFIEANKRTNENPSQVSKTIFF